MSDNHARSTRDDLYDHEHEEPRSARRRRPVADWGVGEDMFEQMPRNRFSRTAEAPPRERRLRAVDAPADAATEAPETPGREVPRGRVEDGRRTLRIGKDEDLPSEIAAIAADRDIHSDEADVPVPPEAAPPAPERRTVKIGGHPEGSLEAARYQRDRSRRPRKTAHDRVGHRPDRIAMWAFALGLLLILIAILTAL
jgi:hypothetical protein